MYPNGVACNLAPIGHLVPQFEVARTFNGPGSAVPFSTQNVYDKTYNRTKATETDQFGTATVTTYVYDSANQLKGEHRSGANGYFTTYVYDSLGSRIQKIDSNQVTSYTYNSANQLLLTQPPTGQPTTSTYDGAGNLKLENVGGALTTYTWDYENRLSSIVTPTTGLTTYIYADNGQKRQTITQAATTNFLWDGVNILQEQDASSNVQAQYTQGPGTWGMLLGQRRGTTDQFYTIDSNQNVRQLIDVNGNVTDALLYKAFGETLSKSGTSVNPLEFAGGVGYYTEIADLLRTLARLYRPSLGRWPTMDPIDFRGGSSNLYQYVLNNPVTGVDPFGLWCVPGICLGPGCHGNPLCAPAGGRTVGSLGLKLLACIKKPKLCLDQNVGGNSVPDDPTVTGGVDLKGACSYVIGDTLLRNCLDNPVELFLKIPGIPPEIQEKLEQWLNYLKGVTLPGYKVEPSLGFCDCIAETICEDFLNVPSGFLACQKAGPGNEEQCNECCDGVAQMCGAAGGFQACLTGCDNLGG